MKLLYMSCHSILEHDELSLFKELGIYVFSPGAYVEPKNPGDASLRPGLNINYDPGDVEAWSAIPCEPGRDKKDVLTKAFVDRFDAVVVMHLPRWISLNWEAMKHKPVVWRTIGQSISHNEASLANYRKAGMKIVRYSPAERTIPGYLGEDALIRFYKNPEEFGNWNGNEASVITFNQHLPERRTACNFDVYCRTLAPLPHKLYGPGNEAMGSIAQGKVSYDQLKAAMRDHRAYFYVGTQPASYTLNFMEAWMTGIPIVAIGPQAGNGRDFPGHQLYEIPSLITPDKNGFWSDSIHEMQSYLDYLLKEPKAAARVGAAGRRSAIETFGKATIAPQWDEFFRSIT